jgi:DNA-binding response OmpR family regulator
MDVPTADKILIVDDSVQITRLLKGILVTEGYRVVITNEAEASLELVREERPVVDVCMPGLDGWELCRRIREETVTPILVLTVLAEKEHGDFALQVGATAHMAKPFLIPAFLEQVRFLLHGGTRPPGAAGG